jgi:hypothetical protein
MTQIERIGKIASAIFILILNPLDPPDLRHLRPVQ